MIPFDAPSYGELVAELAAGRRHLAASEEMRTKSVETLDARTLELSAARTLNVQLLAELRQSETELKEAAKLLRPALPACAGLYDAATARVRAAIDKASPDRAAVPPTENGSMARPRHEDGAGAASNSFPGLRPASDQG